MKNIQTLIKDIYNVVGSGDWHRNQSEGFIRELDSRLVEVSGRQHEVPRLRLSQMGDKCPCQLWHSIHTPELAEPLPPWAKIKYTYGHILEAYVISLAKAAGHQVEGEQDELVVDGIVGHRDCVIDGFVVDVKSSSTLGFRKFREGTIGNDDPFGYLNQLDAYLVGSASDPCVVHKSVGYLLAIDKQLGHMCLYEHHLRQDSILRRVDEYKRIVALPSAPRCTCKIIPDGKSGNQRLDIKGSYNPYKFCCKPNLRTFLYSDGPRYLTHVERRPDVPELDRNGKIIHAHS